MTVALILARAGFRRRRALVGLSVLLAIGVGVALAALEAAHRTENAYPSYLRRAEVGELVVNPSLVTDRVEEIIATTPGVRSYTSHSMLAATPDRGEPRSQRELDSGLSTAFVSTDGRFTQQDRPTVHEGRMVRGGAEAFVSVETAAELGLGVGDPLPLAFWRPNYELQTGRDPLRIVHPIGRTEVTVVGTGVFADEVLADELYPRQRILVTPDVGSAFDCRPRHPAAGDGRSLAELAEELLPPRCALAYRYFSLRIDGGDDGVGPVAAALAERFAEERGNLPEALRGDATGFFLIPAVTAEERRRVQQSLEPAVRALQLFGLGAGGSTLVVALMAAARIARRDERDVRTWLQLGAGRAQRLAGVALPLAAAAAAGLTGALALGWLGSGIGPVASARAVEPAGRLGLSGAVAVATTAAAAVVLAAGIVLATARTVGARLEPAPARPAPGPTAALLRMTSPSLSAGVRAAIQGTGARTLLAASATAVGAVLATAVFTSSLTAFVNRPERFGWPYDAAVIVGFGYGGADPAAIAATLDRPEVEAWGMASLAADSTIDGQPVPLIAGRRGFEVLRLPLIDGALPAADDEIALGALTAGALGLEVGDKALVTTPYGEREATVRGLVVLPSLGPFEAARATLGTGALLSAPFFESIMREGAQEEGADLEAFLDGITSFVAVDLAAGVDSRDFLAAISAELAAWDVNGYEPFAYPDPVRPAPVADVAAMRAVPVALAGVLAVAMAVGLGLGIATATRARRRELAVLRALGCTGRQLGASVHWHAVTVVGVGVVVGLPLGVALGRLSYRAFATGLGFFPEPDVSVVWTLAIVAGAAGTGLLASAAPALRAARSATADALRQE